MNETGAMKSNPTQQNAPSKTNNYLEIGKILYEQGNYESVLLSIERYEDVNGTTVESELLRAKVLEKMGMSSLALIHLSQIQRSNPNNQESLDLIVHNLQQISKGVGYPSAREIAWANKIIQRFESGDRSLTQSDMDSLFAS